MRIKSVKITTDEKISINYQIERENGNYDEFSMTSCDAPLPSFKEALDQLRQHVIDMCELPNMDLDKIVVRGVTFSYGGEDDIMGATIIAWKKLSRSNTDLNINTPHKAAEYYSGNGNGDPKQLLSDECVDDLNIVMSECEKYIKGKRQQLELELELEEVKTQRLK